MALIREIDYEDISGVAQLHQSVGWSPPTLETWRHLWVDNPALSRHTWRPSRGWVLQDQRRIVGFMSNVPQLYRFGDRILGAATAASMVVLPEFRGETMKMVRAFVQQPDVDLLLNTTAAPQTSKIFEFVKFRRIPQPDYNRSLYWVTEPAGFLKSAFLKKGWPASMCDLAGPALAPLLAAELRLRGRRPRVPQRWDSIAAVAPESIGTEFDDLWEQVLGERVRLLAERNTTTLKWHFAARGRNHPPRLICAYAGRRLRGFVALVRSDSPHLRLKRAHIADVFVERDDRETIRQLLASAVLQARDDGVSMLEAVGFPEWVREVFAEFHPFTLLNASWPFLYLARDRDLHRRLEDPALWHACLFDGDGSM